MLSDGSCRKGEGSSSPDFVLSPELEEHSMKGVVRLWGGVPCQVMVHLYTHPQGGGQTTPTKFIYTPTLRIFCCICAIFC